ncbi:transcriptional regulator, TetR family [Nocardioides terrae]|uniref:Transcriptional regulator, TetR family n=1 Tax=Nocardioides terrae TaxID=574651 RepID=A0A1I1J082_9ACTN|nr:transcriptional regulator, TetR family [Nocardioides terrae]
MHTVKRSYDASGRREVARSRRHRVVRAARDLFERDGFRATTIASVAAAAEVSPETVYKAFGSKAVLAKAVFDLALAGDDEPVPIRERPGMLAIRAEHDVRGKIAMFVDGLVQRLERSAKVQIMVRDGRHVDEALVPVWDQLLAEGLTGMEMFGEQLLETGQLRDDLDRDEVRDLLWNYLAIDHYERLVLLRGWSLNHYRQWLSSAITNALCP